jgi:predicted ATPase
MLLTSLQVQGYRCLADVAIPLRSPMVLIGPNGSGKTALLEIFTLLRDAANERLEEALDKRAGISHVLFAGGAESLIIRLTAVDEAQRKLEYSLEIGQRGLGYVIKSETLTREQDSPKSTPKFYIHNVSGRCRYLDPKTKRLKAPTWKFEETETALGQVPRMFRRPAEFRRTLQETQLYHAVDVSEHAVIRLPQTLRPVKLPAPNGGDLYAALYNLRTSNERSFERIQEALSAAFPGFRKLEFPIVTSGQATLAWYQEGFDEPFYPDQLSEGMLRFLWLTTILLSPTLPPIMLIDEPEVSLHPELLMILAGLIREAAQRTQLIVATHADRLIRWLQPNEVVIVDREEDRAGLTWADKLNLGDWLKKYTLDELWLMGELGGRP